MSSKQKSRNDKLILLEERVLVFLKHSNNIQTKQFLNKKNIENNFNLTLNDSLLQSNIIKESQNFNNNNKNNNNNINNDTLSKSITIKKELLKGAEPRFKMKSTPFLQPKFSRNNDLSRSIKLLLIHDMTQSISDFLETDEQIPNFKLYQEKKKNGIFIEKNFPFKILQEEEKCYEEIIKDFKNKGFTNIRYKQKLSTIYLTLLLKENNTIGNIFYHDNEINLFLIREVFIFLCVLFIDEFNGLGENELSDFKTCLYYCHINFLFILMLIVNNSKENDLKNDKENYNYFLKCKRFLHAINDNINEEKFKIEFQNINNIINKTLLNLLNNLSNLNNNITEDLKQIFKISQNQKINEITNSIKQNIKILLKINSIIEEEEIENEKEIENKIKKYTSKTEQNSIENLEITNYKNYEEESSEENLPQPEIPFLKPKDKKDKREYTLVLDLDETLVHYMEDEEENNAYVKVRLGAENFINELSKFCEIVIFTASTEDYANTVINGLDCKNNISFKLYRQHTNFINGFNIKDLSKLGRDISKVIIVDNIEENFSLQPDNGLNICDFEGDENDNELNFLLYDLLDVVKISGLDVRKKLPEVREKMIRRYTIL